VRNRRRLSMEELAPYQLELPELRGHVPMPTETSSPLEPLNWETLFGNNRPVEVEVGFGKGLFLVNTSLEHPERNFFGIEIVRKYQLYATTRIAVRQLPNVKTCCADAKRMLREIIPPNSVSVVHVYFPDPWWKNRHKKRLLFTSDFAESIVRVLQPGGHLKFVSDVKDYFEMVTEMLRGVSALLRTEDPETHEPVHDMDYLTNFERKFRQEGRPIYRSEYEKA
jgi:tRNA (guanine-N7-)-methyltransferase